MTETATPKRSVGRPRTFQTEEALDKAVHLFWQHGYDATSMADMVAVLGLTAPSIYAAFGNKAGLFAAVAERYSATFSAYLYAPVRDEAFTTREAIEALLARAATTFSGPDSPAGCFMYSAGAAVSPAATDIAEMLRGKRTIAEREVTERLARGVERGELPKEFDAAGYSKFLSSVMAGMSVQARDGATLAELQAVAATALKTWPA
ncbi:TetR/AcrR family transcriptional regulator [Asticcacaulis excentricus]|uniref:Regulatory protein TetR n=1 Tax=Asticcacaulis excentricus (strain ATCC 15261 / DSM 4724 / KCTC 12464 / NCIMB 9791 / VKM B-1370 / CB 48) TaxID=573065 RepID=E8RUP2_ASTEC|nr:TetR/AcrR family transcriptional regulator [Asticcacaulis excentricus]ADU14092.1 regulatory protein TetR [Asticcacaulis excentricus CB 48]